MILFNNQYIDESDWNFIQFNNIALKTTVFIIRTWYVTFVSKQWTWNSFIKLFSAECIHLKNCRICMKYSRSHKRVLQAVTLQFLLDPLVWKDFCARTCKNVLAAFEFIVWVCRCKPCICLKSFNIAHLW